MRDNKSNGSKICWPNTKKNPANITQLKKETTPYTTIMGANFLRKKTTFFILINLELIECLFN